MDGNQPLQVAEGLCPDCDYLMRLTDDGEHFECAFCGWRAA